MKTLTSVRSTCLMLVLLAFMGIGTGTADDQTLDPGVVMTYWDELGINIPPAEACVSQTAFPDSGCYSMPEPFGYLPALGYPMRWAIFAGINDTLSFWINFFNRTDKSCDLSDKDCEHWYIPRLYLLGAIGPGAAPLGESDKLSYRIRGWFSGLDMVEPQKELPPLPSGGIGLIMNVWNLPQGRFQVCLEPTDKIPANFTALPGGLTYEFYLPQSLADSINGYYGCFKRAIMDKDYDAAERWVNIILTINPTSVPGNWFKAFRALEVRDTATAKSALDDAVKFLNEQADPALPDSAVRPLHQAEKLYLDELHRILNINRRKLGP